MKSMVQIMRYVALGLLPLCIFSVNATNGSNGGSLGSKNTAIAKVIQVIPSHDNEWMIAKKDLKSPSGYSVEIKKNIDNFWFENYFLAFMYSRSSPQDTLKDFFSSRVWDLLDPSNKHYSNEKFMPRQIMDMILPGQYGKCNVTASTKPIKAGGMVNIDPKDNIDVKLPKKSSFQLVVNILPQEYISDPEHLYYFQVIFSINGVGSTNGSNSKSV